MIEENSIAEGWQDFANCLGVDPDLFFPERGASTREAKEVCRGCVVRGDCLEYALQNSEKFGIWGGMSERERRRIRRQRALERQASEREAIIQIVPDSKAIKLIKIFDQLDSAEPASIASTFRCLRIFLR